MSKKVIQNVRCYDCQFAYLMQSAKVNPVVSECTKTGERNVASTTFPCELFKQNKGNTTINKMKFL